MKFLIDFFPIEYSIHATNMIVSLLLSIIFAIIFIYSGYILYHSLTRYIYFVRKEVAKKFAHDNFLYMTIYIASIIGYILALALMIKMINIIGIVIIAKVINPELEKYDS